MPLAQHGQAERREAGRAAPARRRAPTRRAASRRGRRRAPASARPGAARPPSRAGRRRAPRARRARAPRRGRSTPDHFQRDANGTSRQRRPPAAAERLPRWRRTWSSDVCRRPPPAPGSGAWPSPASAGRRDDLDQLQRAVGERAGLVEADGVDRGERLDRVQLLRERAGASDAHGAGRERHRGQQHQPLRHDRDQAGRRRLRGLAERRVVQPQRRDEDHRQRHHRDQQQAQQRVDLAAAASTGAAWRCGPRAVSFEAYESAPTADLGTGRGRRRSRRPTARVSPGSLRTWSDSPVSIDSSSARLVTRRTHAVGDDLVARLQLDHVVGHDLLRPGSRALRRRGARARAGRTSSAIWSSLRFADSSWAMPIAALMAMMAAKMASFQAPAIAIRIRKPSAIALTSVNTFSRTMRFTEREPVSGSAAARGPARRSAASAEVSPRVSSDVTAGDGTRTVYDAADAAASRRAPARPRGRGGRSPAHRATRVLLLRDDRRARRAGRDPGPASAPSRRSSSVSAMRSPGSHVFAAGYPGTGRGTAIAGLLARIAPTLPVPPDRVFVTRFSAPDRPRLLTLPPGTGVVLGREIDGAARGLLPQRLPLLLEDRELSRQRDARASATASRRSWRWPACAQRAEADGLRRWCRSRPASCRIPRSSPVKRRPAGAARAAAADPLARGVRGEGCASGGARRRAARSRSRLARSRSGASRPSCASWSREPRGHWSTRRSATSTTRARPALAPFLAELRDDIVAAVLELADSGRRGDGAPRAPPRALPRERRRRPHRPRRARRSCRGAVPGPGRT